MKIFACVVTDAGENWQECLFLANGRFQVDEGITFSPEEIEWKQSQVEPESEFGVVDAVTRKSLPMPPEVQSGKDYFLFRRVKGAVA
jgi:hypothetical protein